MMFRVGQGAGRQVYIVELLFWGPRLGWKQSSLLLSIAHCGGQWGT